MKIRLIAKLFLPLLIIFCFFSVSQSFAQNETVAVRIDGRAVFRVNGNENTEAAARARQIERRLTNLLQNPQAIVPAQISAENENRIIAVAGVPIVTVTTAAAQDNLMTADSARRVVDAGD